MDFSDSPSIQARTTSVSDSESEDTCVVITSSWIQSLPTLYFIRHAIDSLSMLKGLSSTAPIFINVDGLPPKVLKNATEYPKRFDQLDQYVQALHREYHNRSNIHIFNHYQYGHISGSVQKSLALIEAKYPDMEFIYYMQHDFYFYNEIHHTGLAQTLREEPETVKIVRFLRAQGRGSDRHYNDPNCTSHEPTRIAKHNVSLRASRAWSDNNHFANFRYYKRQIDYLDPGVSPEGSFQHKVPRAANCSMFGLYLYMDPMTGKKFHALRHIDGRQSTANNIAQREWALVVLLVPS